MNKITLIIAGIALLAAGFAGGYWYGQKKAAEIFINDIIIEDQTRENLSADQIDNIDKIIALLDTVKAETKLDFSEVIDADFDWIIDGDGSSIQVSGKQMSVTNIVNNSKDYDALHANSMKIKDYLTGNGFTMDTNNIAMGTTVGSQGYIKDNLVCTVGGGWNAIEPPENVPATYRLTCGILNQ